MPSPYPLLDLDFGSLPADAAEEVPCPMLGVDPSTRSLTSRVSYLLTRVDGMTSLGDLVGSIPLPPKDLAEALLLLYVEGLVGFSPEFEAKYLQPQGARASVPGGAARPAGTPPAGTTPPVGTAPVRPSSVSTAPGAAAASAAGEGRAVSFTTAPSQPSSLPTSGGAARTGPAAKALTIDRKGSLATRPFAGLARHLQEGRYTGVVTLRRAGVTRRMLFVAGKPGHADSDAPADDLGTMMHAKQKMESPEYTEYQARRKRGEAPGQALVEMGALAPQDVPKAERWRAQALVFDSLMWREGEYEVGEAGSVSADTMRFDLGFPNLVLKAWREAPCDDARKRFFDDHRNWYVVTADIADEAVARMRLNSKEEQLLGAVRGQARRVRDIFEVSTLMLSETYRFIDGLLAMGLGELSEKNPAEAGPVDVADLRDHLRTMETGNYFDRLGAHPVSTDADVEAARVRMLSLYEPKHFINLRPETKEILLKIVALVEDAYKHLREASARKQYRLTQYDRQRLEYFAEIQFKKGEIFLFWRDDPKTAFEIFESSWEMCPDVPLYAVSFALSAIRSFPGDRKRATEARKLVEQALARGTNPKVSVIAAAVMRTLGDVSRSEQLCAAALKASNNSVEIARLVDQVRTSGQPGA